MSFGVPMQLWYEESCEHEPLTAEIRRILPPGRRERVFSKLLGKETLPGLMLRRHRGKFLKPCPGTLNYLCCGYHILNVMLGCPFACAYCILPDYYDNKDITVYVNLDDARREIKAFLEVTDGIKRIGTGEMTDSLALDLWIPLSETLVPFFGTLGNGILELKTKSTNVKALFDLPHNGHTVISWSINPPPVIHTHELGTPDLSERLKAAALCQDRGYYIGLHFDPIIWFEGWRDAYRALVREVFKTLDPQGIIWISLGALRYPPSMQESLINSGLGFAEIIPGLDGKMRYLKPVRSRMFRAVAQWIREEAGEDIFIYLCMESAQIWRDSLGWAPTDSWELDQRFQDRIAHFWRRDRTPSMRPTSTG
jgi:spore photoproduct lyase